MKRCPFCAESIQDEAIFCRFCGKKIPRTQAERRNKNQTSANITLLVIMGIAFVVLVIYFTTIGPEIGLGGRSPVIYEVNGTARSALVEYRGAEGQRVEGTYDLPFKRTIWMLDEVEPYLAAQNEQAVGLVRCIVTRGDSLEMRGKTEEPFGKVICSGQ